MRTKHPNDYNGGKNGFVAGNPRWNRDAEELAALKFELDEIQREQKDLTNEILDAQDFEAMEAEADNWYFDYDLDFDDDFNMADEFDFDPMDDAAFDYDPIEYD